jgi:hypothetical protein
MPAKGFCLEMITSAGRSKRKRVLTRSNQIQMLKINRHVKTIRLQEKELYQRYGDNHFVQNSSNTNIRSNSNEYRINKASSTREISLKRTKGKGVGSIGTPTGKKNMNDVELQQEFSQNMYNNSDM